MAGQTPTPARELPDEQTLRFQMPAYTGGAAILGVAERNMWFETAVFRFTTAEGGAATANLFAFPAAQAPTLANVANGRQLNTAATFIDLDGNTNTLHTMKGSATSNLVKAGETVALIGTSTSTLAGLHGDARFTTRRH